MHWRPNDFEGIQAIKRFLISSLTLALVVGVAIATFDISEFFVKRRAMSMCASASTHQCDHCFCLHKFQICTLLTSSSLAEVTQEIQSIAKAEASRNEIPNTQRNKKGGPQNVVSYPEFAGGFPNQIHNLCAPTCGIRKQRKQPES